MCTQIHEAGILNNNKQVCQQHSVEPRLIPNLPSTQVCHFHRSLQMNGEHCKQIYVICNYLVYDE